MGRKTPAHTQNEEETVTLTFKNFILEDLKNTCVFFAVVGVHYTVELFFKTVTTESRLTLQLTSKRLALVSLQQMKV